MPFRATKKPAAKLARLSLELKYPAYDGLPARSGWVVGLEDMSDLEIRYIYSQIREEIKRRKKAR
jgi:hypothetical protein